jgi:hypothetical protein
VERAWCWGRAVFGGGGGSAGERLGASRWRGGSAGEACPRGRATSGKRRATRAGAARRGGRWGRRTARACGGGCCGAAVFPRRAGAGDRARLVCVADSRRVAGAGLAARYHTPKAPARRIGWAGRARAIDVGLRRRRGRDRVPCGVVSSADAIPIACAGCGRLFRRKTDDVVNVLATTLRRPGSAFVLAIRVVGKGLLCLFPANGSRPW